MIIENGVDGPERIMWITPDRVSYAGLLGMPTTRRMGAYTIYVSFEGRPIGIKIEDGPWEQTDLAVVPPYVLHDVMSESRYIHTLHIEAETVTNNALPIELRTAGAVDAPAFVDVVRQNRQLLLNNCNTPSCASPDFDATYFGLRLPQPRIDRRIARVLDYIKQHPSAPGVAEDCAAIAHLSFSRFLHLFKQEVGAPFRSYRSWKRARNLLHYLTSETKLADVALDTGYPDSTHFSHSIRQVYGLMPSEMFAGSRRLALLDDVSSKMVAAS